MTRWDAWRILLERCQPTGHAHVDSRILRWRERGLDALEEGDSAIAKAAVGWVTVLPRMARLATESESAATLS